MKIEKKIGKIICYNLQVGGFPKSEIVRFQRELFGYMDKSNYGSHTYYREGLLDRIPHIKPVRSVLVIPLEFSGEVLALLGKYGAEIFARNIILEKRDVETLARRGKQG